ncbi:mate-domain-containing protein [Leucosporidium creatinivorum]|uniref:Mate-domain-containing protein n=1 Tax=Leucosporidium creatinivorum TaxID=106004 RepID=A0A1Y2ET44_9BASI|nr:mate-domain-containing protein [Leucosporidium creatinivorum]
MFSYPGSSPASYSGDVSFLQRAAARGDSSLHPPSAASDQDDDSEHDRGRVRKRRGSSGRLSRSSLYSVGGTRLSPTREGSDDSRTWGDEDETAVSDGGERSVSRRGEERFNGHGEPSKGAPTMPLPNFPSTHVVTESTPLLPSSAAPVQEVEDQGSYAHEIKVLVGYTIPIAGTHGLEYSLLVVTVVSLGHLGTVELAAASIANMTANVVALSVIQGFCTALDTLCPQAYTSRPKDTSLYALRTLVLLFIVLIPQTIIFWNSEWILLMLRQDPGVAKHAGLYLKVLSFGLPGYSVFECTRRWLQAQGLMLAPVITLAVAAPLNVLLNYLLVWGPEPIRLGFIGAPIATAISMTTMAVTSVTYAWFTAPRDAWGGLSMDVFNDLSLNIKLGLAGTAMVASEWWCWEIVGLASSFLGPTALAAQSVLLTSASLTYQVPYSLAVAAAVRAGNLLGAQRPKTARVTSRATLALAICVAGFNSIMLVLFRHKWGGLFSSEDDVIALVATVLPLVATFQLTDGLSGATGGLLRGAGKAPLGALINLTSYYVIGLPVGLCLAFLGPKLGLRGLWLGLTLSLSWTAVLTTYVIWNLDWEAGAEEARVRMGGAKRDEEEQSET